MGVTAVVIAGSLLGLAAAQFFFVWGFVQCLKDWKKPLLPDEDCPAAAVILCLRGSDPFLSNCLQGLFAQDYPNYAVKIVIDHAEDPCKQIVDDFMSASHSCTAHSVDVQVLTHIEKTCSLKCSCLIQVVESLDEKIDIVAQLDADTIPHRTWLRELATALEPAHVGVATGNRWYRPTEPTTGSLVRYAWNAAAVVQMYWYSIAWGGSLAIKSAVIRKAGLVELWRRAFCEDTMLLREVGKVGYRVRFVPSLMMINREACDVKSFFLWVRRQLLTARLYHPYWPAVAGHGLISMALPLATLVWMTVCLLGSYWLLAAELAACLIVYQAVMTIMLPWMEFAVCGIATERNAHAKGNGFHAPARLLWIGLLMQWIYTRALISCLLLRTENWRGIEYHIFGPWEITMTAYEPYRPAQPEATQVSSL